MAWAQRIKQIKIRRLYRSARLGIYDEDALQNVGLELYARCADIATVADAFKHGQIPCPQCDTKVQRKINARYGLEGHGNNNHWFSCPQCAKQLLWADCREALRKKPRCFNCQSLLKGNNELKCSCGKTWDNKAYRRSVSTRVRLPCPYCNTVIRRPAFSTDKPGISFDQEIEPHSSVQELQCPKCSAKALHIGGFFECTECEYKRRWRDYRRSLKRRDETLVCPDCNYTFKWQAWRKSAASLVTGNPEPARNFVKEWPKCRTPQERMMKIDFLLQTLHGQGPLAPLFIEGNKESIRRLLDDLASQI